MNISQKNAKYLPHWIATDDFDESDSSTQHVQFHIGDVLEQWQTRKDGLAYGRICQYGSSGKKGHAIDFFFINPSLKA